MATMAEAPKRSWCSALESSMTHFQGSLLHTHGTGNESVGAGRLQSAIPSLHRAILAGLQTWLLPFAGCSVCSVWGLCQAASTVSVDNCSHHHSQHELAPLLAARAARIKAERSQQRSNPLRGLVAIRQLKAADLWPHCCLPNHQDNAWP